MARGTVFHLVRHAAYDGLGHVLAGRTPGYSLNTDGRLQAKSIAEDLAARDIACVASSPLERARETAKPIADRLSLHTRIVPEFNEIDFGDWTNAAFTALDADAAWHRFNVFRSWAAVPAGETVLTAQSRAVAAVQSLAAEYEGGEVVVVSHGDVIRAILVYALGMPLDHVQRLAIWPGSRSVIAFHDDGLQVQSLNIPPGVHGSIQ